MKKTQKKQIALLAAGATLLLSAYAPGGPGAGSRPEVRREAALPANTADSLDAQTGLVLAPGLQAVKSNCLRCHSPKLITGKRASREGWLGTIRWMQQTQGLGDLGRHEAPILDYLARHYAPKQEGRRPALPHIDWYPFKQ